MTLRAVPPAPESDPKLVPYKFQVLAICQSVVDDKVVGELALGVGEGQPFEVFNGVEGLVDFAEGFEDLLSTLPGYTTDGPVPGRGPRGTMGPEDDG